MRRSVRILMGASTIALLTFCHGRADERAEHLTGVRSHVGDAASRRTPDFETEIMPLLTRAGCNSGACHGAAIGRGGFRLSLLGYDPESDYDRLVSQLEGRRVNLARPHSSLVLRKPSAQVVHEGGQRIPEGTEGYQLLSDWIAAGAPRSPTRQFVKLQVMPESAMIDRPGEPVSIQVLAEFHRESETWHEDVTRWCVIAPADPAAVSVEPEGTAIARTPGRHVVTVRYLNAVAAVTISVPIGATQPHNRPRENYVDDHINRTLDELRLPQSPPADDATLVRRLHLDLTGTLPDPSEVDAFLRDGSADRRSRLVERLLDRPEFVDHWSYKWGDWLRIESKRLGAEGAAAFHQWIRDCVQRNTPLDEMARTMLLAVGDRFSNGAANFSRVPANPRDHADYVSQVFLGIRLGCANCHNHPLDRWTQDDYHGLAAVFSRVSRDTGREVRINERGEVIHPKTGAAAVPRLPGAKFLSDGDPREQLATWLTHPDNPHFAAVAANRIWRELMGRGLVEPMDDHRATNPATHPKLLDVLARDLVSSGYDVRHLIRTITASHAYGRSSLAVPGNETDNSFYSKWLVRPLAPHVLVDAVSRATDVPEQFGQLPTGTRAIELSDSRIVSEPLDLLGRCVRDAGCTAAPASNTAASLPLALHTINGTWINAKLRDPAGRLRQLLDAGMDDASLVRDLYRWSLGREPTEDERRHWVEQLALVAESDRSTACEDFFWALLNSAEFCCNH